MLTHHTSVVRELQIKLGVDPDGIFGKDTLQAAMDYYGMSPERAAHFFGQVSHETGGFYTTVENLNYTQEGLYSLFRKYFKTPEEAAKFAHKPEQIANRVYANRMGNGNEASGDGWKYRGRGAIQLTGRKNYLTFSNFIKEPAIMENPELVSTTYAFESAIFFFDTNKLWKLCDMGIAEGIITKVTKVVNGGISGLEDRVARTLKYYTLTQQSK